MFYALRNLFALVGFVAILIAIYVAVKMAPMLQTIDAFDDKAIDVYSEMMTSVLETGNAAEAMVWKVPVSEDLAADDVEETMRFVANEHNIKNVGEEDLYTQFWINEFYDPDDPDSLSNDFVGAIMRWYDRNDPGNYHNSPVPEFSLIGVIISLITITLVGNFIINKHKQKGRKKKK